MSIIYAFIALNNTILCEESEYIGNFQAYSLGLLKKIQQNTQGTFTTNNSEDNALKEYSFHYKNSDGITALTMTQESCPSEIAFSFLDAIIKQFLSNYPNIREETPVQFSKNDFHNQLNMFINEYNNNREDKKSQIDSLKKAIIDTNNELIQASDILDERGQKIQLVVQKAENLSRDSNTFYVASKNVKRSVWMKKIRLIIITVVLVLVAILLLFIVICGFDFKCK